MRSLRVIALGLAGLLAAAGLAMGALRLVRVNLDERSDVDAFPALAPLAPSATRPSPPEVTPSPSEVEPTDGATATPSASPSPSATRSARPSGGDDHHDGTGDDD